jgi:hypothetical protein
MFVVVTELTPDARDQYTYSVSGPFLSAEVAEKAAVVALGNPRVIAAQIYSRELLKTAGADASYEKEFQVIIEEGLFLMGEPPRAAPVSR